MDATALLETLAGHDVTLQPKPGGGLSATGNPEAIAQHRQAIRQHQPALLALLVAAKPAPKPPPSEPAKRVLCVDCADHLTGTDPCGSWWHGRPHTCASFRPAHAHQHNTTNHTEETPCSNA